MCSPSEILRKCSGSSLQLFTAFSKTQLHAFLPDKFLLSAFILFVSFAIVPRSLYALDTINVQVGSDSVIEGESGYIDVYFDVPAGNTYTYDLCAYQIELDLVGSPAGLDFSLFAIPDNPIFPGRTPQWTDSRPPLPGDIAAANDDIPPASSKTVFDNAGLIRVLFDTESGSAGVYNVTIDPSPAYTNFTNSDSKLFSELTTLTVNYLPGTITVTPEPATITLLSIFFALVATYRYLRWR